jgi:murein DD-endopeptidase MepM/ murein hydrolase activator NlpD
VLDLSNTNSLLRNSGDTVLQVLIDYVNSEMARTDAKVAIGRYNEDRVVYQQKELFGGGNEARSVHIGIDLFAPAGTAVRSPLDAVVHSRGFNNRLGDYGPTVILEHRVGDVVFHTLYGHLAESSVTDLREGQTVASGEKLVAFGEASENGGWSP